MRRLASLASLSLVLLAVLGAGCGVVGGSSATKTPTETATPTQTFTPTQTYTPSSTPTPRPTDTPVATATPLPTDTPEPTPTPQPRVLSSDTLPQGRTIVVRIPRSGEASASVTFRGGTHQMLAASDQFWLPIAASATAAIADSDVTVMLFDTAGNVVRTRVTTVSVVAFDFPVEYLEVPVDGPNGLRSPDEVQQEESIRADVYARFTPEKLWSGPFIIPASGAITTEFGTARSFNGGPISIHHSGTDFGAPIGAPVAAAASGRVAYQGLLTTRGMSVIIDHGGGVFTAYHHLSQINVVAGQAVTQGEVIGLVGMTGLATGPHLHWELVVGGVNVDPMPWTLPGVAP